MICILKNRRPIKTTFKYLVGHSFCSKMPTTRMRMTKSENGMKFIMWYTSPNYLIHTKFPEIGGIPKKIFSISS
jgi:hypothetical protein